MTATDTVLGIRVVRSWKSKAETRHTTALGARRPTTARSGLLSGALVGRHEHAAFQAFNFPLGFQCIRFRGLDPAPAGCFRQAHRAIEFAEGGFRFGHGIPRNLYTC